MKPTGYTTLSISGKVYLFLLAFICVYFLSGLIHLGYFPLNGDEPRRAVVSIEMLESGNFIRPTTMGWEYYNKPPVYNWIISFFMVLTGSTSEIPVRLPSLVFILLWGICNYQVVKNILPKRIALLSSLFLATSFDIFFWGLSNGGEIDIFYSFIVYLQVIFIFYFNQQKNWLFLYLFSYLFCAIGFLTKGYPSLLFEGLTLLALCVYNRSVKVLFKWQHLAGIAVFFAITGAYLYVYSFYGSPGRLLANLLKESFNKSAFGEYPERLVSKIITYPVSFLKILLPWSLLLLLLFKKHQFKLWGNPMIRFSLLFILFNIPVYWLTGHPRMRYVYMFLPFCMIILAWIFYQFKEEYPALVNKWVKYLSFLLLTGALAVVLVLPFLFTVNYIWLAIAAIILVFYFAKWAKAGSHIWYLGAGIVLLRLVYALVFIPIKYRDTHLKYDREMAAIAAANNFQPVSIYKEPEKLDIVIDLKVSKINFGSIPAIPYMAYQMPYYYYRTTGKIVTYDTVLQKNKNYIGFGSTLRSTLNSVHTDILYSFEDKNQNNEKIVLFKVPGEKLVLPATTLKAKR